jgi:hypothetical protein
VKVRLNAFLASAADEGEWSASCFSDFNSGKESVVLLTTVLVNPTAILNVVMKESQRHKVILLHQLL